MNTCVLFASIPLEGIEGFLLGKEIKKTFGKNLSRTLSSPEGGRDIGKK